MKFLSSNLNDCNLNILHKFSESTIKFRSRNVDQQRSNPIIKLLRILSLFPNFEIQLFEFKLKLNKIKHKFLHSSHLNHVKFH